MTICSSAGVQQFFGVAKDVAWVPMVADELPLPRDTFAAPHMIQPHSRHVELLAQASEELIEGPDAQIGTAKYSAEPNVDNDAHRLTQHTDLITT